MPKANKSKAKVLKAKRFRVEYSSNNSGGSWWLNDRDWYALEKAGWKVNWIKNDPYYNYKTFTVPDHKDEVRWLGALARSAYRIVEAMNEELAKQSAIHEFEHITGEDAGARGCPCCGQPHYFDAEEYKA